MEAGCSRPMARLPSTLAPPNLPISLMAQPTSEASGPGGSGRRRVREGRRGGSGTQSGVAGRPGGSWGWIFRRCSHHYHFLLPSQLPLPPSVGKRSCGTCTSAHHLPPVCLPPDTLLPPGHQEGCEAVFKLTNNVSNQGGSSMEQLSLSSRDRS